MIIGAKQDMGVSPFNTFIVEKEKGWRLSTIPKRRTSILLDRTEDTVTRIS